MTLRFLGTRYHGSQIQQNAFTVQEAFQRALEGPLGGRPDIKCCSRTDAGVHANMFCISFKTDKAIQPARLMSALNARLDRDIRVTDCREMGEDFHARYSAKGKRYIYQIWNAPVLDPFMAGRAAHIPRPIDAGMMNQAAQIFVGTHDFKAFGSARVGDKDTVRTVSVCSVVRQGELIVIAITADGFLYHMARAMAGALVNVARGRLTAEDLAERLCTGLRDNLIMTAPAEGLYLDEVFY